MATHDEIERDQYQQIHSLAAEVHTLAGTVEIANKINEKLLRLMTKVFYCMFFIILVLIGAIIYGAIGRDGLYSVREALPVNPPTLAWWRSPPDLPPDPRIFPYRHTA